MSILTPNNGTPNDFSDNLRHLCNQRRSVSEICRSTGINRQQFNKYLSGLHRPSKVNMRIIAQYFGLTPEILELPAEDFRLLIDGSYFRIMDQLRDTPKVRAFMDTMTLAASEMSNDLIGTYDRYQYSSIYPGRILRAAFCIYRNADLLQHFYVERFPDPDFPQRVDSIFKYHGFTFAVADRIFMVDFESIQRNELTFSICAPQKRSSRKFLYGITTGIAATALRQPYATSVALHYRNSQLLIRDGLKRSTLLDANSTEIPEEVRRHLREAPSMIKM
ncbi:helix-turn-helix domain-containing protein [Hoeflea sp.]|uniref:helix-turn-helix domain-containing protein n=1 Tax=Hoeflea sp. TaxID=1940281 RepID=UPI003A8ED810